jgi:hypothetical protein
MCCPGCTQVTALHARLIHVPNTPMTTSMSVFGGVVGPAGSGVVVGSGVVGSGNVVGSGVVGSGVGSGVVGAGIVDVKTHVSS